MFFPEKFLWYKTKSLLQPKTLPLGSGIENLEAMSSQGTAGPVSGRLA